MGQSWRWVCAIEDLWYSFVEFVFRSPQLPPHHGTLLLPAVLPRREPNRNKDADLELWVCSLSNNQRRRKERQSECFCQEDSLRKKLKRSGITTTPPEIKDWGALISFGLYQGELVAETVLRQERQPRPIRALQSRRKTDAIPHPTTLFHLPTHSSPYKTRSKKTK